MEKIKILQGNCIDKIKELDDNSIDCVVSSPPYFGLRDYGTASYDGGDPNCKHTISDGSFDPLKNKLIGRPYRTKDKKNCVKCGAKRIDEQFGLETTYQEYIANTVKVFETFKPKLKDTATIWWNVGDSYNNKLESLKEKDLMMIPNRVAIALQDAGWYIRSEIIWHKPNPMPESVTDRPTSAHEKIWLINKSKKYYYNADAIREPLASSSLARLSQDIKNQKGSTRANGGMKSNGNMKAVFSEKNIKGNFSKRGITRTTEGLNLKTQLEKINPLGRNKRNVWTITTKPFKDAHFATFPKDLIEPCIKAGCPEKVCVECGTPYKKNYNRKRIRRDELDPSDYRYRPNKYKGAYEEINGKGDAGYQSSEFIGFEKDCNCKTDKFESGVVLDPFGGSGTTGIVAKSLNRQAILIELNKDYINIVNKRIDKELGMFSGS